MVHFRIFCLEKISTNNSIFHIIPKISPLENKPPENKPPKSLHANKPENKPPENKPWAYC